MEETVATKFVDSDVQVRKVQIPVRGMSCASCVEKVERALRGVDGVSANSRYLP